MDWKKLNPDRRKILLEMLIADARSYLATAKGMRKPEAAAYFQEMREVFSAAVQALQKLGSE